MEFQVGDVVKLKSGGPKMTVSEVNVKFLDSITRLILCIWFENGRRESGKFKPEELEKTEK